MTMEFLIETLRCKITVDTSILARMKLFLKKINEHVFPLSILNS